jgi:peptide/nickel transport system substrate-binding protein
MKNRLSKFLVIAVALLLMATAVLGCQPASAPVAEPPAAEAPAAEAPATEVPEAEAPAPATEEPAPTAEEPAPVDSGPTLPRNETLYVAGHQWSPLVGWNPYSSNNNNWGISAGASARVIIFETPYMYNMIDGEFYPLLADGDYEWNDDMTEITFKIKPAAKWSDGTPVTAEDFAYTYATHLKYETGAGVNYGEFIETIEAVDTNTVLVKAALNDEGKAVNPLQVISYLCSEYVAQKAWTETLEARVGGDATELKADTGDDFVASGPYLSFYSDDQKVVFIRDDNYWGQDASMWGKLPPPKYLAHQIYGDNNAGFIALKAGQVDVSQQFNANVQDLWLVDKLPISTYMDEAPYSITASLPTAYFNLKKHGLDRVEVRKAIAMAVDYDTIIANAMTNQSPTFQQVPRSVMNPTAGEQALYNHDAVKDLQFAGDDVEGAKKLLDDAGIVDTDGDGYRDIDGKRLSYNAVCPNGWSDWQAAIEIVAAAGEKIGIEIVTYFPEWGVYQTVFTDGNQEEYDIFMVWSNGAGPTNPWGRVRQLMSSEFAGTTGNWNGNWGGYVNPRIDELVKLIPNETDMEKLKEYYTEATEIYLTDVPSFSLMYRPDQFHTVNETVWTNYPEADDGLNIPPTNLINGYGVSGLYNITLVNP